MTSEIGRVFLKYTEPNVKNRHISQTAEMAQWLRILTGLTEDLVLVPSTHMAAHNPL